jgi:2-dehydro-3-deoxygluconokinase
MSEERTSSGTGIDGGRSGTDGPELVTFGETMLRLSPPSGDRIETADQLNVHVGGAESNVAVAASNLGVDATWISKLPAGPPGRRVVRALRAADVEPAVAWSQEGRQGLYYFERGGRPRGHQVVYDRREAAVTTATPAELPTDGLETADAVFTSGITPALSDRLAETTGELLDRAHDAGATVAFDVNYRSKLWDPEKARRTIEPLLESVDLLFCASRDAETVLDCTGDPIDVAGTLADDYGLDTVVVTLGESGAVAVTGDGTCERSTPPTDTVDPVGSGDALVGGYLARRLQGGSTEEALEYGVATAAIERTVAGDVAVLEPAEVEAVLEDPDSGIDR